VRGGFRVAQLAVTERRPVEHATRIVAKSGQGAVDQLSYA
jgi:hypothetical protein